MDCYFHYGGHTRVLLSVHEPHLDSKLSSKLQISLAHVCSLCFLQPFVFE